MTSYIQTLAKQLSQFATADGYFPTLIPGLFVARNSVVGKPEKREWSASLAIVAAGAKEIVVGNEIYTCGVGNFTLSPLSLPVVSRIGKGSAKEPFLCLLLRLDPRMLTELAVQMDTGDDERVEPIQAMFKGKASTEILETAVRLMNTLSHPADAKIVGPLLVKELLYRALVLPEGAAVREFVRKGSKTQLISQAIHILRSDLTTNVDVGLLAKQVRMSESAFFKHFKTVTALSPIQYQKRLRLLEAKRLMQEHGETAESSAFAVGYNSASQFSREYSRMFGVSPTRDTAKRSR